MRFGDQNDSQEASVAEMGAAFTCAIVGVENVAIQKNSAAYLAGWMKTIKGDKTMVIQAAAAASKAVDDILGDYDEDTTPAA